jgi:hypothetical protein
VFTQDFIVFVNFINVLSKLFNTLDNLNIACNPKTPNLQYLPNPTLLGKKTPPLASKHLKMGG